MQVLNKTKPLINWLNLLINNKLFFYSFVLIGIIIFSFQLLIISNIAPVWDSFGDPGDYRFQSTKPFFSFDFLSPLPSKLHASRPFTTAFFYKIAESNPYKMIMVQKLTYVFCTIIFSYSFIYFIESFVLKIVSFYLLLFLFSWLNIVGWTNNILSEPTSNSLLFLWFAVLIFYIKQNNWLVTFLFCLVSLFFSFTRDSWPYIILLATIIILGGNLFFNKKDLLKNGVVLFFCFLLFIIQGKTSEIGERHKVPVFNNIVGRVSKSDEYLKWFENHGMPLSSKIKKDFKYENVDSSRTFIYSKYFDSEYLPLMNWSVKEGKSVYLLFMVTHPSYFFLSDQSSKQINRIFCFNFYQYFINDSKPNDYTQTTFPAWDLHTTIILVLLLFLFSFYFKNALYAIPLLIAFLFLINALILYNADTMEVERHLYITQIIIQLLNIISFSLLINIFINLFKRKLDGI